ncbi:nucleotide pyrophosphatase/phosphodiesterase family protein [Rubrivirga sp. IMCC45206]|uniref:nucleotide pyrophosphatase/phosphodiesterase family protein n=1 Tax=Rubrivirga sp. IMCC45206 TaxID=3391614 RepID=UPI00399019B7
MPTRPTLLAALALLLAVYVGQTLAGCAGAEPTPPPQPEADRALVLVSIDGFRWDYLDRGLDTPAFDWVAEGARAERLVPVFPTKTFPNHYSLVTGLHPEDHGIVGNTMRDPERLVDGEPARFSLSNRQAVADGRWWAGEPIWVTAERQGVAAAPVFWPGSEAEIGGVRPSRWLPYDGSMPYAARADQALEWLDEGAGFVTFYVEAVDNAGHRHGPDAPETAAAIEEADAALGHLLDGLRQRGRLDATDIVVVSDHGMVPVSRERVVLLDDAVDYETVDVDWGEVVGLWPDAGVDVDALIAHISALPHLTAMRKADVPARLHYSDHARIPPVVVLVDPGWTASSQTYLDRNPDRPSGGAHGYDNAEPGLHGILLARGPHLRTGAIGAVSTVDVYNVLAGALGITPAPNSGDPAVAARLLR